MGWASTGRSVKGGAGQVVIPIKLSFCPRLGPSSFDPQQGHCFSSSGLSTWGRKMWALFLDFYPSIALVGTGWEGLHGGASRRQQDKGSPCLCPSALRGLHGALRSPSAQHRAGCVGGGEGIMGRHIPLLYFGKIALVNSVSRLTIK